MPVAVRLSNTAVDKHITQLVGAPSWKSVIPGGFASASFTLRSPIDSKDPALAPFTRVYIYDARSGETLWEGRLQIAGRTAGDQGEVWSLTAIGPSAHTLDQTVPLIYIDRRLDGWIRDTLEGSFISPSATAGPGSDPLVDGQDAVVCGWPDNVTLNSSPSSRAQAGYYGFVGSGMELGAVAFSWVAGFTSGNYLTEAVVGAAPTYTVIPTSASVITTGGADNPDWVIDEFTGGKDIVGVRVRRSAGGATTTSGDAFWVSFRNLRVLGRRMSKAGVLLNGATEHGNSSIYVRASWVVEDLLGRLLTQFDGAGATISAADTVDIDQLAYLDGATASQVLEDLMKLEPSSYWAAWESNSAGKYRFEWRTWPTTPRYEATVADGFDNPAPAFDQYNKVVVRWRDARGRIQRTTRTQTVPELSAAGITRSWFEDLADEVGSSANAIKVGDNFLADHLKPTSGGTLTIARPILDVISGRRVDPWQIRPGEVIRVRGIEASADSGVGSDRDGLTVFRIVSVEVGDEGVATLELDMFTRDEVRALTDVLKRRYRKR